VQAGDRFRGGGEGGIAAAMARSSWDRPDRGAPAAIRYPKDSTLIAAGCCRWRRTLTRLPGTEGKVLNAAWPRFQTGPLAPAGDRAAGRLCPQPRLRTDAGDDVLLDELIGDGFAILTRRQGTGAYDTETRQFFDALDTRVLHLDDTAAATDIDGALTTLLDDIGVDALLLRPDRVVVASADRPDLRGWRRSLEQAGVTAAASHGGPASR
jgi:hypothetical protein